MDKEKVLEYRRDLVECVKVRVADSGEGPTLQFIKTIIDDLSGAKSICDPVLFYWSGMSTRRGQILLYGYDFDESDQSLSIFTGEFNDSDDPQQLNASTINNLSLQALRFVQETLSPRTSENFRMSLENEALDFYDFLLEKKDSQLGINKVKVIVASDGYLSNRVTRLPLPDVLENIDTEIQVWDITWLCDNIYAVNDPESADVDFSEYSDIVPNGVPCLIVPQADENYECYLASIPGKLLSSLYRKYGSQLLEGNVRSFLTSKTAVNKQIQGTIHNNPNKFFIFNNGIATTADSIEIDVDQTGYSGIIRNIHGMQIINGGQTTASLAFAEQKTKADLTGISVQMKLTVLHVQASERVSDIQTISKSSNSQNKVSDADFFANHEFHNRMEKFSNALRVPPAIGVPYSTFWYYERMKGQYQQATLFNTASEKKQYYDRRPKSQRITKEELAKYHCILRGNSVAVNKGPTECFKVLSKTIQNDWDNEISKAKYNELYYKQIAVVALLLRTMEGEMTKKKQGYWVGSYRANMIYFSLMQFFRLVKDQYPEEALNTDYIWNKNCISQDLLQLLITMAKKVYDVFNDPRRQITNVTQWCKNPSCDATVTEAFSEFKIPQNVIAQYLIDKSISSGNERDVKIVQGTMNEVELLTKVCSEPYKSRWYKLQIFINKNQSLFRLSPKQMTAMKVMVKLSFGKFTSPNVEQCKDALKIWQDALALGWKE
ncbi:MAG: AIPR family protein [Candidatus Cloacimonetes bacterium]|nr:AIPR family protein [Candidatus Cloacimonadota bacterium]